jgi:hypothetical protein
MNAPRQIFVLRLMAQPNIDEVKALRFALKGLLRRCGLRCLSVEVETAKPSIKSEEAS